jgi:hypothetical protein
MLVLRRYSFVCYVDLLLVENALMMLSLTYVTARAP